MLTRVNVVPPSELTNGQLLAEYREIPRVYRMVQKAIDRGEPVGYKVPAQFCYGVGALRFWYNKLRFIKLRQVALRDEMLKRNYKPLKHADPLSEGDYGISDPTYWQDYLPTEEALALNRRRLRRRAKSAEARAAARRSAAGKPKDLEEFLHYL